jgi:signal transduction histidine kinase
VSGVHDAGLACLFLGVLAAMAAYHGVLCMLVRQREHAWFSLMSACFALTLGAWASQRGLLPTAGEMRGAQLVSLVCGALSVASALMLLRALRPDRGLPAWYREPDPYLAKLAWRFLSAGLLLGLLHGLGGSPLPGLTLWALPLGAAVHVLLLSLHLAARLDTLRENVGAANEELSSKVSFLEDAIARATENTERAEQAARVKDEFMATMSHELRTPLNAIINLPPGLLRDFPVFHQVYCEGCRAVFELEENEDPRDERVCPDCPEHTPLRSQEQVRYVGAPENTLRYLEKIERSGVHLLQVVNGILDAEQVKTGQLALTFGESDIAELTREVIEEMSDLAERGGVKLVLDNVAEGSRTVVDRLRLRQVLINLISNAIKFSDRRGSVYVSVKAASDGFRFAVRDEGIGIAADKLESVFGSFEQVHQPDQRKFGGTGLGLFISRSLVRKHGGEMWVESTLGAGATFRFHIPRRERARSTANLRDSQVFSIARSLS